MTASFRFGSFSRQGIAFGIPVADLQPRHRAGRAAARIGRRRGGRPAPGKRLGAENVVLRGNQPHQAAIERPRRGSPASGGCRAANPDGADSLLDAEQDLAYPAHPGEYCPPVEPRLGGPRVAEDHAGLRNGHGGKRQASERKPAVRSGDRANFEALLRTVLQGKRYAEARPPRTTPTQRSSTTRPRT